MLDEVTLRDTGPGASPAHRREPGTAMAGAAPAPARPMAATGPLQAYAEWLVHIDGSPRSAERLALARRLAQVAGGQVLAMHAVTPVWTELPMSALGDGGAVVLLQQADEERQRAARRLFDAEATRSGAPLSWSDGPAAKGGGALMPAVTRLAARALCSDVLVLGQQDRDDPLTWGVPSDLIPGVLTASGRPALVVPRVGHFETVGRRVLVAWKSSRESARALGSALPWLKTAQRVEIARWNEPGWRYGETAPDQPGMPPPSDAWLRDWLQAHGVNAHITHEGDASADIGELLLSRAADTDADLLVMGCYGHTRAREWLLGGATRSVLQSMTLPVWMAH